MAKIRFAARTVDMLGRQQVAGVPTAIHELFKNAHDAYATHAEVDYWRRDALLLLRDDGHGMSRTDFEDRWLSVATDSKVEGGTLPSPLPDGVAGTGPMKRAVLGEKGIGRLSMATLGPLVLVLTRPAGDRASITIALIHWRLFEVPGIWGDMVDIPVEEHSTDSLPAPDMIARLKAGILANADALDEIHPSPILDDVRVDLRALELDLPLLYSRIGGLRLDGPGRSGTHFLVMPADRIIERDIDDDERDIASPLRRTLLGFANTMLPNLPPPAVATAFRDHRTDGTFNDIIAGESFFTPSEFKEADHCIIGNFDEYGRFNGSVTVFGTEPQPYDVVWREAAGRQTLCGPFKLAFGYVMGNARDSRLDPEQHARMIEKLDKIGGIYLYRDGIRILPYGNSDYDFLLIEVRRNKHQGRNFFSYRRMFGAIETTRAANSNLNEKAGREGFKENEAYRQFRRVLENFLVQLAADFFVEGGKNAETYQEVRIDLNRKEQVRKRREKRVRERQVRLSQDLARVFTLVEDGTAARRAKEIQNGAERRVRSAASVEDVNVAAAEMLRVQADARRELSDLRKLFTVTKPTGVGLSKTLLREWTAYKEEAARLEREVHIPLAVAVDRIVGEVAEEMALPLDRRRQTDLIVGGGTATVRRELAAQVRILAESAEAVRGTLLAAGRASMVRLDEKVRDVEGRLAATDLTLISDEDFYGLSERLVSEIEAVGQAEVGTCIELRDRVSRATAPPSDEPYADELTEVLEEELSGLKEEMDLNLELAQVGMALGIVQHEFRAAVRQIRANIRSLAPWAQRNAGLKPIHRDLKNAFEHLDGYLTMFAPLDRRMRRTKVGLSGERVLEFLRELFETRLKQKRAQVQASDAFRARELFGYPSTFLPVFVNLVDNALHWLPDSGVGFNGVNLDVDGRDLTVSDTGSGVPARDREAVFEYGFSRKPGGRGLGLHISRQVLRRLGWDLVVDAYVSGGGARFRLVPPADDNASLPATDDGDISK